MSAIELIVALTLTLLLGGLVLRSVREAVRLHTRVVAASDGLVTAGLLRHVLGSEIRAGEAADREAGESTVSLSIRAFRATALVCPDRSPGPSPVVWVRGDRRADPRKDSLLVLRASGRWIAVALERRSTSSPACPPAPGVDTETWELSEPVPDAVLARVFERGSYHLSGGALRWSRGAGGRQPLTPQRLLDDRSALALHASGVDVTVGLAPAIPGRVARERTWALRGRSLP